MKISSQKKYQLFENLRKEEFTALEQDIIKRGIKVPIEVDESGNILDGHNRIAIARKHNIEYETIKRKFRNEEEKREHIIKLNLARRMLQPWQWGKAFRELLKVRGVKLGSGGKMDRGQSATVALCTKEIGVPRRTAFHRMEQATEYENLSAKQKEEVREGTESLTDIIRNKKKDITRTERMKEIGNIKGKYFLIYADPPWRYERTISSSREVERHYPTMELEEIKAAKPFGKPIQEFVGDDAILYLWTPNPKLEEALEVLNAWGFTYRTNMAWIKDSIGPGYWVRSRHELLLIGTKGAPPTPKVNLRPDSVIEAPRRKHSEKPETMYGFLEKMFPKCRRLEMFNRQERKGWDCWGNEPEVKK